MKKIIAFVLLIILTVGGIFGYRYYPIYKTCKDMENSMEFKGEFSVKKDKLKNQDPDSNVLISESGRKVLSLIESGTIEGEYTDGVFHGLIYKDGVENALMEIYRTGEGKYLLNIGQLITWGAEYYTNESFFPVKWLPGLIKSSVNLYFSGEQLAELLDMEKTADTNESEGSDNAMSWMQLAKKLNAKTVKIEENDLEITGLQMEWKEDASPVHFKLTAWKRAEDKGQLMIPEEVKLSEEQIQVIKTVLQKIAEAADKQ